MGISAEQLDNLQLIRQSAKDFAETYIRPHVMEWDEIQHFPMDLFHDMGKLGFLGVLVPEAYGGTPMRSNFGSPVEIWSLI